MPRKALGLIETMGLVAAYGAADAALKSAKVSLIGFDFPGNGGTTVKIEGEISAVESAISAGVSAAEKIYIVLSHSVIPKPYDDLDSVIRVKPVVRTSAKKISTKRPEKG
ncbi:MAG: BMC domain-containing protein [bacterium]